MPFSLSCSAGGSRRKLSFSLVCISLIAFVFATGCRAHAPHTSPTVSLRSAAFVPLSVGQVQSSPLYQQARQDCTRHAYRRAAEDLQTLAHTPGLAPETVTFVEQQRDLCLRDAGLLPSLPVVTASLPARAPADADCGPRALLIVCQKLGIKTNLETLRTLAGTTPKGTTMAGLQQAAQKLGLQAEGVQVSREALPDVSPPAIIWLHRNHYAVLTGVQRRGDYAQCSISDPNHPGEQTWMQEQLLQQSGGFLLLLHR